MDIIEDKKAENITLLDLRPDAIQADFLVIATANSDRQIGALLEYVRQGIKENYRRIPFSVDGMPQTGWIVMDYGDVVLHLFMEEERSYYDLESIWHEKSKVLLSIQ